MRTADSLKLSPTHLLIFNLYIMKKPKSVKPDILKQASQIFILSFYIHCRLS
jgi:hypothetical protein